MGKIVYIEATDLGDAWFQVLEKIISVGRKYTITKGSFEGQYRLGIPVIVEIKFPGTRPLFPQMPEGSIVPAPTTEEDINEYSTYVMTPICQPNEHYAYGEDLYWQIEWVINHYKEGGHGNNHCYMTVGRPETLYFYDLNADYSEVIFVQERVSGRQAQPISGRQITNKWNKDPGNKPSSQCLRGIDTWIDEDGLNFWIYFRSWDHWGGFPVNLGGIQLMKEYMAAELGVKDGTMIVSSKDLHLYEHAEGAALLRLRKEEKKKEV